MSEGNEKLVQNAGFSGADNTLKMSKMTRDTLQRCRKMIPPMLPHFHKGESEYDSVLGGGIMISTSKGCCSERVEETLTSSQVKWAE